MHVTRDSKVMVLLERLRDCTYATGRMFYWGIIGATADVRVCIVRSIQVADC